MGGDLYGRYNPMKWTVSAALNDVCLCSGGGGGSGVGVYGTCLLRGSWQGEQDIATISSISS